MKRKFTRILSLILVALIAVTALSGCNGSSAPPGHEGEGETIGTGATSFRFEVIDEEGNTRAWNVYTDETSVGAALLGVGLIAGIDSDFGLMVTHVNDIRADFMEDGAFWAFYVDGEFAMAGVDETDIEAGATYAFVYTPA